MKIGGLAKSKIVAGELGLDREIEYITVMEVPDVIQWLHGNDLLITSLYPIKDDASAIEQIVSQLVEKGSAALAIKTHRFVDQIPDVIIAEANRLCFPIIEIDEKVSYIDIMTPLMGSIMNRSTLEQKNVENVLKWITELSLGGKGIKAIVREVEKLIGNKITVEGEFLSAESHEGNVMIEPLSWKQKKDLRQAKCSINMQRMYGHKIIPCIVTPIIMNEILYGHITCWQTHKRFREVDFMILDRVVLLLALEFLKVKTRYDVEQGYKDELLRSILHSRIKENEELHEKAKMFGWNLSLNYQVILIDIKKIKKTLEVNNHDSIYIQDYVRKIIRHVERYLDTQSKHTIVGLKAEEIVLLVPQNMFMVTAPTKYKDKLFLFTESLLSSLGLEFAEAAFVIGIGRCYDGLGGIHNGYIEARKSLQLGQNIWPMKRNIHFDDLGVYRILGSFPDRQELLAIYNETIGKLVEYDQANKSNLLDTLQAYFAHDFMLTTTADKLFIHVNTLKYKLQKIKQITGYNIQRSEDRLWLHIGLKIHDLLSTE